MLPALLASASSALTWLNCSDNVPASLAADNITASTVFPSSLLCGRLAVPLDYSGQTAGNVSLFFTLNRAADEEPGQGALIWNSGGPGDPDAAIGFYLATNATVDNAMLTPFVGAFDIINLDVRGVGASTPLNCSGDALKRLDASLPDSQAAFDRGKQLSADFLATCNATTLPFFSADSIAQDMNALRHALNYERVHGLFMSAGTLIAQELLERYPDTLDRLVLDGVLARGLSTTESYAISLNATARLLARTDAFCLANPACPFTGQGKGAVQRAFSTVMQMAVNGSYASSNVTASDIRTRFSLSTGGDIVPDRIADELSLALHGNVTAFAGGPWPQAVLDQSLIVALECGLEASPNITFDLVRQLQQIQAKNDPIRIVDVFPSFWTSLCSGYTGVTLSQQPVYTNKTYMLVNGDFDANTPFEQAVLVWSRSPNATFVERHGDGHVTFDRPNVLDNAARNAEISYLLTGVLPTATSNSSYTVYDASAPRNLTVADPYSVPVGPAAGQPPLP